MSRRDRQTARKSTCGIPRRRHRGGDDEDDYSTDDNSTVLDYPRLRNTHPYLFAQQLRARMFQGRYQEDNRLRDHIATVPIQGNSRRIPTRAWYHPQRQNAPSTSTSASSNQNVEPSVVPRETVASRPDAVPSHSGPSDVNSGPSNDEELSLGQNPLELVQDLECPICYEIPVDVRVYSCTTGHSICETCYERDRNAPCRMCRSPLRGTRNFVVETLAKKIFAKCKYPRCDVVLKGQELADHIKICEYRPIKCFETNVSACNGALIEQQNYLNHLKTIHCARGHQRPLNSRGLRSMRKEKFEIDLARTTDDVKVISEPFFMGYENDNFLRNIKIHNDNLYIWISHIGPEKQANNYFAKVSIFANSDLPYERKMSWHFPIHSCHQKLADVENLGHCVTMSIERDLKSYLRQDILEVQYIVKNKEEEDEIMNS